MLTCKMGTIRTNKKQKPPILQKSYKGKHHSKLLEESAGCLYTYTTLLHISCHFLPKRDLFKFPYS